MSDDIMPNTTAIIDCFLIGAAIIGDPWMIGALIYVELGLGHHVIENFLEGTVDRGGWHKTYIVCRVSPGPRLIACLKLGAV